MTQEVPPFRHRCSRRAALAGCAGLATAGCRRGYGPVLAPTLVFGDAGAHDGQFHQPREVGFSPDGSRLYILDRTQRVQMFTSQGEFQETWPTPPGGKGNPRGLDVDPEGRVFVADTHHSQVLVYDPGGSLVRRWGRFGKGPGEFIAVTDVAVAADGCTWTCEYGEYNDRIQKFDPEGKWILTTGSFGTAPGQFSRPQGLAFGPDRSLYVADAVNHRVQVLDDTGRVVALIGQVGARPGELKYPYSVAFDGQGRLYVVEYGNERVSVFRPGGRFLTTFGRPGRAPGELDRPWGVSVARNGDIYVADTMNYRIQRFPPLS